MTVWVCICGFEWSTPHPLLSVFHRNPDVHGDEEVPMTRQADQWR